MKQILIIAEGILAKHFLDRVFSLKNVTHDYKIILPNINDKIDENISDNVKFYHFDPTSFERLKNFYQDEYHQAMIILSNEQETIWTYKNLRVLNQNLEIYLLDLWGLKDIEKNHTKLIDVREIIGTRLIDLLPDIPIFADNVGLTQGEIMEAKVPVGSSFAYRKVGSINQKKWKIAMIYRHNKFEIAQKTSIIMPNDNLLMVGNPQVLKDIFKNIKQEYGQFPSPFGKNIFVILDLKNMRGEIENLVKNSIKFFEKVAAKKLFFYVINPKFSKDFEFIKSLRENFFITIDYFSTNLKELKFQISNHKSGVIVTTNNFFEKNKKEFFDLNLPILKVANFDIQNIKSAVVLSDEKNISSESSVIFDLCLQLNIDLNLHCFGENYGETIEEFSNLSKIFNKNLNIVKSHTNPILNLRKKSEFLQFLSFDEKLMKSKISAIFSKDLNSLYFELAANYQIFIPNSKENYENSDKTGKK